MKCQPSDIRYAVVAIKRGIPTIIPSLTGYLTRAEADKHRPDRGVSQTIGYISNHRRHYNDSMRLTKNTAPNVSPD